MHKLLQWVTGENSCSVGVRCTLLPQQKQQQQEKARQLHSLLQQQNLSKGGNGNSKSTFYNAFCWLAVDCTAPLFRHRPLSVCSSLSLVVALFSCSRFVQLFQFSIARKCSWLNRSSCSVVLFIFFYTSSRHVYVYSSWNRASPEASPYCRNTPWRIWSLNPLCR